MNTLLHQVEWSNSVKALVEKYSPQFDRLKVECDKREEARRVAFEARNNKQPKEITSYEPSK